MSDYSEPANASLIVPDRVRVQVLRRGRGGVGGLEVRQGQGDRDPGGRAARPRRAPTASTCCPTAPSSGGWKLITPTGWTDWNTACEIVAKSAKEVGIGITTEFPQAPTMYLRAAERRLRPGDVHLHRREPGQPVDALPRRAGRPGRARRSARRRSGTTTGSPTPRSRPCWTPRPAAKSDAEAKTAYAAARQDLPRERARWCR